ncbi:hypothetical protein R6Q57_004908 [Mikania cordata]
MTEEPPLLPPPPLPPMSQMPSGRILRTQTAGALGGEAMMDSEVVPSSLVEIAPILRVANEVESTNLRVAYLCRFYAFEKSHYLDSCSSGRGVRQFKTALLQRLERDNDPSLISRVKKSDALEMQSFYQHYYSKYIQALQSARDKADRAQLTKAYHPTASVLFEVLKAVNRAQSMDVEEKILEAHVKVSQKAEIYLPYNILPLDPDSANHAIMRYPELDEHALDKVMKKLLKNYKKWCEFLGRKSSLWLPTVHTEVQQRKLLYMGLFLLIWGEAANLRFMPECLCYIYHHMAFEMYGILAGNVSPMTGEDVKPAYGGEQEAFLKEVVSPIYHVIAMAMIIVAWHDAGNPTTIFDYDVLKKVLSVFITASILNFGQGMLNS